MLENSTIAAVATPPGEGGIAVVRLSGPESFRVAEQVFRPMDRRKQVAQARGYTALYGQFADGEERFDDGIALFFRAPHSYTGEDVVELSCHGGNAVARRLVEACLAAGAVPAGPGEYTRRALLNGKLSLTQAEAVMDLISAGGRQGAALANAARGGALARKIAAQQQALTGLQAHLTAWVDFPEEDVPALEDGPLRASLEEVKAALDELIGGYNAAAVLREGIDCAIVGRPNAGKSSLLNALAGYERAIVTDIPGTIRDTVEENVELGGVPLRLIDTAGLRDSADPIEQLGVERSRAAMEEAELILLVVDAAAEVTAEDAELARAVAESGKPWIFVAAKQDLVERSTSVGLIGAEAARTVELSSKTGEGLDSLARAVAELFPRDAGSGYGELLTNARQAQAAQRALEGVKRAREALELGVTPDALLTDVEEALSALGELTGQSVREDVTARIFQRFCVGK